MNSLKKCLSITLYSNLFISFCAAAFSIETYLLVQAEINWFYISFVFLSTLVLYNFPTLWEENFSPEYSERHKWVSENKKLLLLISALAFAGVIVIIFFFPLKFVLWFAPVALIGFAYFFPQTQLRSITGLKAVIVTFVWTSITAIYPLLLVSNFEWSNFTVAGRGGIILQNFFFMFPLCVIFNVRDIEADKNAGVRTFPVIYGVKATIAICIASLITFSVLVIFSFLGMEIKAGLIISAAVTAVLILHASSDQKDHYYSLWIDGMILLQAGLVVFEKFLLLLGSRYF